MKKREAKLSILSLLIVTTITILLMIVVLNTKTRVQAKYYDQKLAAAKTAQNASAAVKQAVNAMGMPIDRINDPNETGLIGIQYSPITTARGDLTPVLTSTNPNFAGLIVQLLNEAGLKKHDTVAVLLTGSLPALNLSVMSAIQTLGLVPVTITSIGSGMWGANFPLFTYLDMEAVLIRAGIFEYGTAAAAIGGEDDIGRGLSPAGREMIDSAATRNDVAILNGTSLEDMIARKIAFFEGGGRIKALVNAGDRTTAFAGLEMRSGLIRPHTVRTGSGLIAHFSQKGIPIIELSDIAQLAQDYDLPVAPIPLPIPGEGRLYREYRYSVTAAAIAAVCIALILFVVLRYDIDHYLKRRKND